MDNISEILVQDEETEILTPKTVIYNVSFCEKESLHNYDITDNNSLLDEEAAISKDDVKNIPSYKRKGSVVSWQEMPFTPSPSSSAYQTPLNQFQESHSRSIPRTSFKQNPLYTSSSYKTSYSDVEISSSPKRLIYCVHGKPSGCCVVAEGEIVDKSLSHASVPIERNDSNATIFSEHCHKYTNNLKENKSARRKLILASILCVLFMIGESVGGILSSSLAIATDAAHLLTDFASFMISLFSLWMANRPATRQMSFGWYRAEVIGALTSVLMIWVVTGILVYLAIERVVNRNFEIDAFVMLVTSGVGVGVNLVMGLTLHQHGHSHLGSSHTHNIEDSSEGEHSHENINVRAAFIHVLGDFIQSVGVLVAAVIIYFKPEWSLVDPICTFLFSILVLITTFAIIRDTLTVLMEGMPKGIDFNDVLETFLQIDGVIKVHNLRIWALSLDKTALSAHLAIRPGVSPQKILRQASRKIHSKFNFLEMTLQIEEFSSKMDDCLQCKCPES